VEKVHDVVLAKGNKPETDRHVHRLLHEALEYVIEMTELSHNAAERKVKLPEIKRYRGYGLRVDDVIWLFGSEKDD